jgi:arylsulfatase
MTETRIGTFHYNVLGIKSYAIEATKPIPTGKTQVRMEFAYDGGGSGKGGTVTLYSDGTEVGKGRVEQTQGIIFSADEATDIGYESGTTVSPDYTAHTSRFTGKINWVQIDLGKDSEDADHYISAEERMRVAMARQ